MLTRVCLLILLIALPAVAQQPGQKTAKSTKKAAVLSKEAEELRLSAVSQLHSLVQTANEIDNIAERVRVMTEIGDAFWPVDQEYARTMLVWSFKEIGKLSDGSEDDPERLASSKRALRRVVLSRIAKHDPPLVNQLLHDSANDPLTPDEKAMQQQGVATPNADALLSIAENLLATDPKRAATIAAYTLQDGLSQRLRLFLMRLLSKDSAAADSLVRMAISQASAQHPARLFDVMILWDYAWQPQDFYFNGILLNRGWAPRQGTPQDLKRSVLAFAVTAIVENVQLIPTNAESPQDRITAQMQLGALHSVIQQLLPSMQVDWPRGTADLQQAIVRVEQELKNIGQTAPTRPPFPDPESSKSAVDDLLEKAAAASQGDGRDDLYLAAAFRLFQTRHFEQGKEIASKIDNQEQRAMILEPLNFRLVGDLIEKNRLQETLNVANELKTPELRIAALARVGRAFIESGDTQTGLQTLDAAQSAASKADPSIEVSAATMRIAAAFAKSNPVRSSEAINLAIQILNKAKQDEIAWGVMAPAAYDDALSLTWKNAPGGGIRSIEAAFPRNGDFTELLSKLEFNEAISIAKSVNKKALSLMAQATVCRTAIEATEVKTSASSSN
jgi:chaperonin cofactor prefoldin